VSVGVWWVGSCAKCFLFSSAMGGKGLVAYSNGVKTFEVLDFSQP